MSTPRVVFVATTAAAVCGAMLLGCSGMGMGRESRGGGGDTGAERARATSTIRTTGGTVRVDDVGSVDVPAGAFDGPTDVTLVRAAAANAVESFGDAAVLFGVRRPLPYEYRVNAAAGQPNAPIEVEVVLPRKWRRMAAADPAIDASALRVFGRNVWTSGGGGGDDAGGDAGRLVTLEPLPGTYDPRGGSLRVSVPPAFFSEANPGAGGDAVAAVLRLALTDAGEDPADASSDDAGGATSPTTTVGTAAAAPSAEAAGAGGGCDLPLGPPLRGKFTRTTPFGPTDAGGVARFHPGTDYAPDAALGDAGREVLAVADGRVLAAGAQTNRDGEPVGWGRYVIVAHGRRDAAPFTLYATLAPDQVGARPGQRVTRGDVIARVGGGEGGEGNSGGEAGGNELHLEFVPGGRPAGAVAKADPSDCYSGVLVEHLVAGMRSSAIVAAPDLDVETQSVELRGTAADNVRRPFATRARAKDAGLTYTGDATGAVVTVVDGRRFRFEYDADAAAAVDAGPRAPTHPEGAAATVSGNGRVRFRTTRPAAYRLTIRYDVSDAAQYRVDARFQAVGDGGESPRPVDGDLKRAAASGKGPTKFDQTFEGRLAEHQTFDFEFHPAIVGGGAEARGTLDATAVLEVIPDAQ